MYNLLLSAVFLFLFSSSLVAQIQGQVIDEHGQPLQDVSVYLQNTSIGTITNSSGDYILKIDKPEKGTLVFKFLGYQTVDIDLSKSSETINVQLEIETVALSEVVLDANYNPANRIIKAVQERRKKLLDESKRYTADFYSKGLIRMDSVPKKLFGQDVGDFEGAIDSTRSGVLYLSETRSKIFSNRNDFKEIITASKVSGNDNGFSFNSAEEAYFNLYEQTISVGALLASPLGTNAFSFYDYKLVGTFTAAGKLINQIQVIPKRTSDPTVSGYLYIVENDWALYGVDITANSGQTNSNILDQITIRQTYNYQEQSQQWVKATQLIMAEFGIFGFNGTARFSYVFSNYNLNPRFSSGTFGALVQEFLPESNRKDSIFWETQRPVALTQEEIRDYARKDSIARVRKNPVYLDSIDRINNRLKFSDINGKTIENRSKKSRWIISSPLSEFGFNPVQGRYTTLGVTYIKKDEKETKYSHFNIKTGYGLEDNTWYPHISYTRKFNSKNHARLQISAGKTLTQFDQKPPISPLINEMVNLLFKENPAKWYENTHFGAKFRTRLLPQLSMVYDLKWQERKERFNITNYSWIKKEKQYPSNRPDSSIFDFTNHRINIQKLIIGYFFGIKYYADPDRYFYRQKETAPMVRLSLTHGFGSTVDRYDFLKFELSLRKKIQWNAYGTSSFILRGGSFLYKNSPAFSDITHFHGNETFIASESNYLNSFNLLPYYKRSTDKPYTTLHWEHNFIRFGVGSWPIIKQLKANFIISAHALMIEGAPSYGEWTVGLGNLGIGKIRGLRIDYVHALGDIIKKQGIVVSFKLF